MNEALKLAKFHARQEEKNRLLSLLSHPVTIMIGGCAAVELLQHISLGKQPAQPGYFSWGTDIGWHSAKPAQEIALLSQGLGSAIEVAILLWGAGSQTATLVEQLGAMGKAASNLLPGATTALALIPK